jgi:hypothetical protein
VCSWELVNDQAAAAGGGGGDGSLGGFPGCTACPEGRYSPPGPSLPGVYCPGACVAGKSSPSGSVDTGSGEDPCHACPPGNTSSFAR